MRCLDASFLIDLVRDVPEAVRKAESLATSGEHLSVAAPALAELLIGAYHRGGEDLRKTIDLVAQLDVVEVDAEVAAEAGRLGAELLRRGEAAPMVDLLIAACTTMRKMVLVSRDVAFSRIPGVVVETY